MLAGAYPSDEFAELKPRVVWDRVTDVVEGRRDARVVAVTSGGTIPDRGLFGVFMAGEAGTPGRRVGELDEEMVYELRAGMHGDVIVLGASSWRVDDIGHDRVTVSPAPGVPGKLPFWKGDAVGRPIELGRAIGAFVGELEADLAAGRRAGRLPRRGCARRTTSTSAPRTTCSPTSTTSARSTGALPTDKRIVVERFRDELGDWRLCLLTPFGGRVHAPWSLAIEARLGERLGLEVQTIWSDDGIAIRLPEGDAPLDGIEALLFPEADEVEDLVVGQLAHVGPVRQPVPRERGPGAAPAAPPARDADAALAAAPAGGRPARGRLALRLASRSSSRPTASACRTSSTCRRCARSWPASRAARSPSTASRPPQASPFASSLLFDYVAAYMYDGDAPLAERRARRADARSRPAARAARPGGAARAARPRGAGRPRAVPPGADRGAPGDDPRRHPRPAAPARRPDHGRGRGPDARAAAPRPARGSTSWRPPGGRCATRIAGDERWIAIEDVARYRDGVGISPPVGVPEAFLGPAVAALDGLLARWARTHGPFLTPEPARRWGLPAGRRRGRARAAGRGRARSCAASSGRAAPNASGATRRSCGCSAAARWRGSGARSSRSTRRRSRGSCRTGRASPRSAAARPPPFRGTRRPRAAGRGRRPAGRACRSRRPSWSATCSRPGSRATSRGCSTSSARWARSAWVGRGSLGRDDGRIALVRPGREVAPADRRARRRRAAGRAAPRRHPRAPGRRAARRSTASSSRPRRRRTRTARSSTRCGTSSGPARSPTTRSRRCGPCAGSGPAAAPADRRPRAGRLTALGPPEAAGRWSLVAPDARAARPTRPSGSTPLSLALLERHGVLTREAVAAEGIDGGFAAVYPILRAMEEAGRIRRGYFVDGLGAAQFALAGALDRLRAVREPADAPATRRASTCWPRPIRPTRTAPRCPGRAAARPTGGRSSAPPAPTSCSSTASPRSTSSAAASTLQTLPPSDDPAVRGRRGRVRCARSSPTAGSASSSSARSTASRSATLAVARRARSRPGFVAGYRGLVLRGAPER